MSRVRRWRLFGVTLESAFPFGTRLTVGAGEPDLVFECGPPPELPMADAPRLYASPQRIESGERLCVLRRAGAWDILRFAGIGDFYISSRRIVAHLARGVDQRLVEIRFLGSVLAYWLERRGTLALHASAVVVEGRVIVFMSGNFSGKTGLAASLVREGHPLLTDDILPIEERAGEIWARPGYPQMRMWPDLAEHFLGSCDELEPVHPTLDKRRVKLEPEDFCARERPLARLYLPERRPVAELSRCVIRPVSARDAAIELVRYSFSPFLVEAAGLQPDRLDRIARLLEQVPTRRVLYPEDFGRLQGTALAILADISKSVQPPE